MKVNPILIAFAAAAAAFATSAQAQPVEDMLQRDAALQQRIATDIARGRIDAHSAARLEQRSAELHRLEARLLAVTVPDLAANARVDHARNRLASAINGAERHRSKYEGSALERMRLRVAVQRNADEQRLIARKYHDWTLTPAQLGELEKAQAQIAQAEYRAASKPHETVAAAESVQHLQDLQDYAIRRDPALA
jgi:hypothetical protein